jgi:hypothetical protein
VLAFPSPTVAHSSRGPGRRPLTPVTRVRIPYALPDAILSLLLKQPPLSVPIWVIWLTHMKTTVEIAEDLFTRAREVAQGEGTTLRNLIEEGLRVALARREQAVAPYLWPDLSVSGEGLAPDIAEGSWELLRDRIYAGRGV